MDIMLFQGISTARLKEWATVEDDIAFVRLPDNAHEARLTLAQWQDVVARYEAKVQPSAWWLRLAFLLTLPVGIVLLLTISSVPMLKAGFEAFTDVIPI